MAIVEHELESAPGCGAPLPWRRRDWLGAALALPLARARAADPPSLRVPVLVYHRFAAQVADSMTVRTARFEAHLRLLEDRGCTVIPLGWLVEWRLGLRPDLPARPVVLTADDGHRSVYEVMAPRLRARRWPVTLFIYPSAISNASYAMRWEQLRELQAGGTVTIESHTYWHPNLLREQRQRSAQDFRQFAEGQLKRSKAVLEQLLGRRVLLLAWPFGLSDPGLWDLAAAAGYRAAFGLQARACTRTEPRYDLPRYLMVDAVDERQLGHWLDGAHREAGRS